MVFCIGMKVKEHDESQNDYHFNYRFMKAITTSILDKSFSSCIMRTETGKECFTFIYIQASHPREKIETQRVPTHFHL